MEIVIELVVKDVFKAAEFYIEYLGFKIDFTEFEPVSWIQLRNGNTRLMLVTYDFTKNDIKNFKEYSESTNIYKFCYKSLDEVKEIYEKMKKDNKNIIVDLREADYRYEFGVYDEDRNMIFITKETVGNDN